jgi:3-oxoacyl-[acyl-carrier-protein] synthase-3
MEDQNQYMRLNGIDVFNYSLKLVPNNILDLLKFAEKNIEFPDLYVFHQANKVINDAISRKLKLDIEKVPCSLYEFGNTASASIPLTLGSNWNKTIINSGWILLSGFGVGFSLASALIPFEPKFCSAPEEM